MEKNVLLVYPKCPESFWSFKHVLKFISRKSLSPPLGLLTVSSMLPKNWNKKLVDMNVRKLTEKDIKWADIIMISAMIVQKKSAKEVIKKCKALGKTVIAGGPAFTTQHEEFSGVDHFVLDEGEITLPLFLKDFEKGVPKKIYHSKEKPSLIQTPIPDWSLINQKDYVTMVVQYSRGCPFNCEFCDIIIMNGRIPRTKTPEQLISELQSLYEKGWRGAVFIVDDNFIGNKIKVKQMLPELIKWQKEHNYPFGFLTEASLNLADDEELLQLMHEANFDKVFLGIETPSINSLEECGKMQNTKRDLTKSIEKIQKSGLQVMGGFIVGFDSDTDGIFESQIKFIQKAGIVNAMVGVLTALPRTKLWKRLKSEGRLLKDSSGENTTINFSPKMGKEKLSKGYKKIISTIYSPKKYFERISIFLKNYTPKLKTKVSTEDIKAFFKSIWKIGIISKARIQYWKLLIKTLKTKKEFMPIVVEYAICWRHFSKISRKTIKQNNI